MLQRKLLIQTTHFVYTHMITILMNVPRFLLGVSGHLFNVAENIILGVIKRSHLEAKCLRTTFLKTFF